MKRLILLIILSGPAIAAISQITTDSSSNTVTASVEQLYRKGIGESSMLFNGTEYYYDDRSLNGHPFLATTNFIEGSITYNGVTYKKVPLSYDILRDQLIAFLPAEAGDVKMKLITEKINAFSIGERRFIHLVKDSLTNIGEGFYEVLYQGKTMLLAKRSKKIKENVSASGVDKQVEEVNVYYIKKNNFYYPVHSKSSLLDVFKENKSQVSRFINQSDIRYNKDVEYNLIRAVRYFDQITTEK